jgi:hypothetical protein
MENLRNAQPAPGFVGAVCLSFSNPYGVLPLPLGKKENK